MRLRGCLHNDEWWKKRRQTDERKSTCELICWPMSTNVSHWNDNKIFSPSKEGRKRANKGKSRRLPWKKYNKWAIEPMKLDYRIPYIFFLGGGGVRISSFPLIFNSSIISFFFHFSFLFLFFLFFSIILPLSIFFLSALHGVCLKYPFKFCVFPRLPSASALRFSVFVKKKNEYGNGCAWWR